MDRFGVSLGAPLQVPLRVPEMDLLSKILALGFL